MLASFTISTAGNYDLINLTAKIKKAVKDSKVKEGVAVVFAKHTTVGLTIMEWEEGCKRDLVEVWEKWIPQKGNYRHEKWHDGNGAAHLKSALLPPTLSIPITGGELTLGVWQNIVLVDFDVRAREREIVVKIVEA